MAASSMDGHALVHGGDDLVDEFAADRPDAAAADDLAGGRVGQQFHEAVLGFHDERFAVIVERVAGGQIGDVARRAALFSVRPTTATCGSVKTTSVSRR